jgi:hypothetical protein
MKAIFYAKMVVGAVLVALGLGILEPFIAGLAPGVTIHYTASVLAVLTSGAASVFGGIWVVTTTFKGSTSSTGPTNTSQL